MSNREGISPVIEFIEKLEKNIEEYYMVHGDREPDTNSFIFDTPVMESYAEGLETALELAKEFVKDKTN